jgi:hypothetical protein
LFFLKHRNLETHIAFVWFWMFQNIHITKTFPGEENIRSSRIIREIYFRIATCYNHWIFNTCLEEAHCLVLYPAVISLRKVLGIRLGKETQTKKRTREDKPLM